MDTIRYNRCTECEEENFFTDGSQCARCLGLNALPIDKDDEEESMSGELEYLAAA